MTDRLRKRFDGLFVETFSGERSPAPPVVSGGGLDRSRVLTNERRPAPLRNHVERLCREGQSEEPIR